MKPDPKKPKRSRPPVTITLSKEALEMAAVLKKHEGATLSQLVERWIRDAFREGGLSVPSRGEIVTHE